VFTEHLEYPPLLLATFTFMTNGLLLWWTLDMYRYPEPALSRCSCIGPRTIENSVETPHKFHCVAVDCIALNY